MKVPNECNLPKIEGMRGEFYLMAGSFSVFQLEAFLLTGRLRGECGCMLGDCECGLVA